MMAGGDHGMSPSADDEDDDLALSSQGERDPDVGIAGSTETNEEKIDNRAQTDEGEEDGMMMQPSTPSRKVFYSTMDSVGMTGFHSQALLMTNLQLFIYSSQSLCHCVTLRTVLLLLSCRFRSPPLKCRFSLKRNMMARP